MVLTDIVKFPNSTRTLTSTVVQCYCRQYLVQLSTLQFTHYAYRNIAVAGSCLFEVEKSSWVSKCNVDYCSWKLIDRLLIFKSTSLIEATVFIDAMVPTDTLKCRWVLDFPNSTRSHSTSTVQCRQSLVKLSTLRLSHVPFSSLTMNTAMPLSLVPDCVLDSLAVTSPSIHLTTLF